MHPFLADLALQGEFAIDLVGERRPERRARVLADGTDLVVGSITRLHRTDQPPAKGVIDLQCSITPQRAGHSGNG
jgi:hypothetical protein